MDRKARILAPLDARGRGLEIGPSHNPVAPKRAGYAVDILDHADRAALVEKYREHGVDLDAIEEVDFVWSGGSYAELTGRRGYYDWIIASHVIEHMPDLIGFLNDCDALLGEGGVLSLAVPDKRYCFDRLRAPTGLSQLIDAHLQGRSNHTPGQVADYFLNVVKLDGRIAWDAALAQGRSLDAVEFVHTAQDASAGMDAVRQHDAYLDIHAWCFTPSGFRLLLDDLHRLGLVALRESAFGDTHGHEFYVALSRDGAGPGRDRLALMREAETEMAACAL